MGGGIIIVPVLVFSFTLQGFDPQVLTLAVGTSLATIIFTSVNAVREHLIGRARCVGRSLLWMTVGILIGAGFGALTAEAISALHLQKIIGVFALLVAVQLALEVA